MTRHTPQRFSHERYPSFPSPFICLAGLFVFVLPFAGRLVDVGARILLKLARYRSRCRHCECVMCEAGVGSATTTRGSLVVTSDVLNGRERKRIYHGARGTWDDVSLTDIDPGRSVASSGALGCGACSVTSLSACSGGMEATTVARHPPETLSMIALGYVRGMRGSARQQHAARRGQQAVGNRQQAVRQLAGSQAAVTSSAAPCPLPVRSLGSCRSLIAYTAFQLPASSLLAAHITVSNQGLLLSGGASGVWAQPARGASGSRAR